MDVGSRFPGALFVAVGFPVHETVEVDTHPLTTEKGMHFLLLRTLDFN